MIYAYDIFKVQNGALTKLSVTCDVVKDINGKPVIRDGKTVQKDAKACISDLAGLARNFGVGLITTLFFAILLVALCWVLLMRAIKLWIYIMFSPLFGLAYFTDKGFKDGFHSDS